MDNREREKEDPHDFHQGSIRRAELTGLIATVVLALFMVVALVWGIVLIFYVLSPCMESKRTVNETVIVAGPAIIFSNPEISDTIVGINVISADSLYSDTTGFYNALISGTMDGRKGVTYIPSPDPRDPGNRVIVNIITLVDEQYQPEDSIDGVGPLILIGSELTPNFNENDLTYLWVHPPGYTIHLKIKTNISKVKTEDLAEIIKREVWAYLPRTYDRSRFFKNRKINNDYPFKLYRLTNPIQQR